MHLSGTAFTHDATSAAKFQGSVHGAGHESGCAHPRIPAHGGAGAGGRGQRGEHVQVHLVLEVERLIERPEPAAQAALARARLLLRAD